MGKTHRKYLDHREFIAEKRKYPNVCLGTTAIPCSNRLQSIEHRFYYKLTVPDQTTILDALVLPNNICVILPPSLSDFENVVNYSKLLLSISNDQITGKFKKGADIIQSGTNIIEISCTNGDKIQYKTPIGGQLLEINKNIDDINILKKQEYICIIMPNTEIPSLDGHRDYSSLLNYVVNKRNDKSCFAWKEGKCLRGDQCKFVHDMSLISSNNMIQNDEDSLRIDAYDECDNIDTKRLKLS